MIIPDVNLLLYAYDEASPFHARAKSWWSNCLSGSEPVGLVAAVLFAFIRIGTNPKVFEMPFSAAEATRHVQEWLEAPPTEFLAVARADVVPLSYLPVSPSNKNPGRYEALCEHRVARSKNLMVRKDDSTTRTRGGSPLAIYRQDGEDSRRQPKNTIPLLRDYASSSFLFIRGGGLCRGQFSAADL
jgi:hypothetical protein